MRDPSYTLIDTQLETSLVTTAPITLGEDFPGEYEEQALGFLSLCQK